MIEHTGLEHAYLLAADGVLYAWCIQVLLRMARALLGVRVRVSGRRGQQLEATTAQLRPGQIPAAAPMRPRTTPFPVEKSILGVIYGVILWADMHAATPLGAWDCSVMSLVTAYAGEDMGQTLDSY